MKRKDSSYAAVGMRMEKTVLFGAGKVGKEATYILKNQGKEITYFIDNDSKKWGNKILNIPVISLEEYKKMSDNYELIIACNDKNRKQIIDQLKAENILNFSYVDEWEMVEKKERIISYSQPFDMEDVILYHVLHNQSKIFYIDIGSNDPFTCSVTKLLYDTRDAYGINVEPQKGLFEITCRERRRDINLCVGVGNEAGEAELYIQGGLSTILEENVVNEKCHSEKIKIVTLAQICEKHIVDNQEISFLKIDVEGAEKNVLEGADFEKYRPHIVVMESTLPNTLVPTYEEWEGILLQADYHYVYSYGVNRYYVANEKAEDFDNRFVDIEELKLTYSIFYASLER